MNAHGDRIKWLSNEMETLRDEMGARPKRLRPVNGAAVCTSVSGPPDRSY